MPFPRSLFLSLLITCSILHCSKNEAGPSFEFTAHHIKIKFDATTGTLVATDTVSLKFSKNVDHIFFFLHDSLHVEKVTIGPQELEIDPISSDVIDLLKDMPLETELADQCQIVQVRIPQSLYPKRVEVWYSGQMSLDGAIDPGWHPFMPGVPAQFEVWALLPDFVVPRHMPSLDKVGCEDAWCLWKVDNIERTGVCRLFLQMNK